MIEYKCRDFKASPGSPDIKKKTADAGSGTRNMKTPPTPSCGRVLVAMISIAVLLGLTVSSLSAEDREAPVLTEGDRSTPDTASDATTKHSPQRAKQLALLAIMKILNRMPQDFRPTASGWDKLKFPKAAEWFKEYARGKRIKIPIFLSQVSTKYLGKDKYKIMVRYRLHGPDFSFSDFPMRFAPGLPRISGKTLYIGYSGVVVTHLGDEALARQWGNTPKYTPLFVEGTISAASLTFTRTQRKPVCSLRLANIRVSSEAALSTEQPTKETPDAGKPTKETAGVSSMLAVLNRMPKDLLPGAKDGWDELTLPKVNEWLARYSPKKPFRGQLAFDSCYVRHIKANTYRATASLEIVPDAKITFKNQTIWLRMTRIHASLTDSRGGTYLTKVYSVNQDAAAKWKKMPEGKRFDIGGQVVTATLKPAHRNGERVKNGYVCLFRVLVSTVSEHQAKRTVASKPQQTPKSTSSKAESRLRFAKSYLSSGLKEKAIPILKEVIEKYPKTSAAEAAEKLLRDAEGR
jgi:hypothetical protein